MYSSTQHVPTRLCACMQYAVTAMLWQVAEQFGWRVRRFSATTSAPFAAQVAAAAATGLLVSRHGPLLASVPFLPPGAAVYELLPFNWEWRQISQLYRNMSVSTRQIHHAAWRPDSVEWAEYVSDDDRRYSTWTSEECQSRCVGRPHRGSGLPISCSWPAPFCVRCRSCLLVHARAGLRVDVEHVRRDLMELLPALHRDDPDCVDAECRVQRLDLEFGSGWPTTRRHSS